MHSWKNCRHSCAQCRDNRQPLQRKKQQHLQRGQSLPQFLPVLLFS
uniref:Uncharacterized protein n=1 Tax=Siphoviridae sp. ctv4j104 TaxID=2826510 RepID=A0A8S5M9U4_9CAUD|nr:MAG TPA: hypothetical protein [Siphoviridae sp. ctv4j104]